jgi:hypothetical protein
MVVHELIQVREKDIDYGKVKKIITTTYNKKAIRIRNETEALFFSIAFTAFKPLLNESRRIF